jgi:hypothetical protein
MAKIKYVGSKPSRQDTVAGTGIVWHGNGDVKEVPDLAVPRLLRHPDIWCIAADEPKKAPAKVETTEQQGSDEGQESEQPSGDKGSAPEFVMATDNGPLVLDGMDRDTLMALAVEAGLKPHPKTGVAKLQALLVEKFPLKAD